VRQDVALPVLPARFQSRQPRRGRQWGTSRQGARIHQSRDEPPSRGGGRQACKPRVRGAGRQACKPRVRGGGRQACRAESRLRFSYFKAFRFPIAYKALSVRKNICPSEIAIVLRQYSSMLFSATISNFGPALKTVVSPSSFVM
jgi:hypothetical protein